MLLDSFRDVYSDDRISEIIIVDDCSDETIYSQLESIFYHFPKIRLFRNSFNLDCYRNKKRAVELATNEFCILLDSDNIIDKNYIDVIFSYQWGRKTIYTPSFAKPSFNFTQYENILVSSSNVSEYIDKPMFEVCLNAANYFVNRNEYIKVWDGSVDPVTSDSIFHCYNWLKNGNSILIVPGLNYEHRIHEGSHYKTQNHRTPKNFHQSILNKLRELK